MDQHIYHILTAARVQNEDVLGTTISTLFLGVFLEIYPQGDSIYSEIFQMCPGGLWVAIPLKSQGILHPSHSGDSEESHLSQGLPGVVSLLTPCC